MNPVEIFDINISRKLTKRKNSFLILLLSNLGSLSSMVIFLFILFFFGKEINYIIESILSLSYATGFVFILKFSVKRKRESDNIDKIRKKIDPYSFPSGHISRIFSVASPFYPVLIPILITSFLGIISSYARICRGYHYFSDCAAGLLIGIFSSLCAKITMQTLLPFLFSTVLNHSY